MSYPGYELNQYQRDAARTGGSDLTERATPQGLSCAGLGIAGEAGEVADMIKKHVHHGVPLDEDKLRKEIGDVLWYLAHLCSVMQWSLGDIAEENIEKLHKSYPDGFSTEASIARKDLAP